MCVVANPDGTLSTTPAPTTDTAVDTANYAMKGNGGAGGGGNGGNGGGGGGGGNATGGATSGGNPGDNATGGANEGLGNNSGTSGTGQNGDMNTPSPGTATNNPVDQQEFPNAGLGSYNNDPDTGPGGSNLSDEIQDPEYGNDSDIGGETETEIGGGGETENDGGTTTPTTTPSKSGPNKYKQDSRGQVDDLIGDISRRNRNRTLLGPLGLPGNAGTKRTMLGGS